MPAAKQAGRREAGPEAVPMLTTLISDGFTGVYRCQHCQIVHFNHMQFSLCHLSRAVLK